MNQQPTARIIIIGPKTATPMPSAETMPPTIVPPRIAAKVADSIQALALGSSLRSR